MTQKFLDCFYQGKGKKNPLSNNWLSYIECYPRRFKKRYANQEILSLGSVEDELHREGNLYKAASALAEAVNLSMILRKPLLLTGEPGCGKTSLAYSIAWELGLKPILKWNIKSTTTLKDGVYNYDAIGRLQALQASKEDPDIKYDIGEFMCLGPLGTALASEDSPRVLLIDEIDKSDIDFPDELLHELEEFSCTIPELKIYNQPSVEVKPYDDDNPVKISNGTIKYGMPPIVVITNNREREFSTAFTRRCIEFNCDSLMKEEHLVNIVIKNFAHDFTEDQIKSEIEEIKSEGYDLNVSRLLEWFSICKRKSEMSPDAKSRVLKSTKED